MINKYRVHEVAKDFDLPSKKVVELLAKYFDDPKKHMTALEEIELDVIFETFTKEREVESFDAYFATKIEKKPEEKPAPAKKEEPAQAKAEPAKKQGSGEPNKNCRPLSAKTKPLPMANFHLKELTADN